MIYSTTSIHPRGPATMKLVKPEGGDTFKDHICVTMPAHTRLYIDAGRGNGCNAQTDTDGDTTLYLDTAAARALAESILRLLPAEQERAA